MAVTRVPKGSQRWGFIFVNGQVMLGRGLSHTPTPLYLPPLTISSSHCALFQNLGKNYTHGSVTSLINISAASRISVQVFMQTTGPVFYPFPSSTMPYQTKAFVHILSHQFLIMLTQKLEKEDGLQVVIRSGDATVFKKLKAGIMLP
jgi:hypothetical protein